MRLICTHSGLLDKWPRIIDREFIIQIHFVRWSCISLGISIDIAFPNIEIHLPFGFLRIGWNGTTKNQPPVKFTLN